MKKTKRENKMFKFIFAPPDTRLLGKLVLGLKNVLLIIKSTCGLKKKTGHVLYFQV